MTKKKRQGVISLPKLVTVVTFTLVTVLSVDFGRKALDNYHIGRQVEWLRQQVAVEQQTNESLEARLEYVSSDAYVEKIARERLKLVKPGEAAVVVVPETTEQPSAQGQGFAPERSEEEALPYWQQWLNLLVGGDH